MVKKTPHGRVTQNQCAPFLWNWPKPFVFLALFVVVGCTGTPDRIALSEPVADAAVQQIYVAAGHIPSAEALDVRQDRNARAQVVRYSVSVPATHALGQIEWPDSEVDARIDFAVVDVDHLAGSEDLLQAINSKPGDEVAVFVHGYNTTPSEALYRYAQIGHDFNITSPKVLFSWPSAGLPTGYVYDRDSVLFSRDPFADLLTDISRRTDKEITLMAHSMGAHLTMEVLRQLAITGRRDVLNDLRVVVFLAPDIDPDIFRAQAKAIGKLPDPFVIMTNRGDRALNLSAFLNIGRQKVGDLSRAADVAGLNVTLFDFTALADGTNRDHLVPMTSPLAIAVLRDLVNSDRRGQLDLSAFEIGEDGVIRAKPLKGNGDV